MGQLSQQPPPPPRQPPPVESCGDLRYGVRCTLPKGHDGLHQHRPREGGLMLCWDE